MSASTTPVGTVLMYAGRTDGAGVLNLITAGWILCDGSVYPNSQFPDLFTVLGNSYGGTSSGFAVPEYKGLFLRGLDGSDPNQRDPGAATRTAPRPDLSNARQHRQQRRLGAARLAGGAHAQLQLLQPLPQEHAHPGPRMPLGLYHVVGVERG
ncbi:MAG: phage tail protein [Micropruina glycogenica]